MPRNAHRCAMLRRHSMAAGWRAGATLPRVGSGHSRHSAQHGVAAPTSLAATATTTHSSATHKTHLRRLSAAGPTSSSVMTPPARLSRDKSRTRWRARHSEAQSRTPRTRQGSRRPVLPAVTPRGSRGDNVDNGVEQRVRELRAMLSSVSSRPRPDGVATAMERKLAPLQHAGRVLHGSTALLTDAPFGRQLRLARADAAVVRWWARRLLLQWGARCKQDNIEDAAARVVQTIARGFHARAVLYPRQKQARLERALAARENVARMLREAQRPPPTGDVELDATRVLQRMARRYLIARNAHAVTVQRVARGGTARRRFLTQRSSAIRLQAWARHRRWYLWRKRYLGARHLQTVWRGYHQHSQYKRYMGARAMQTSWRGYACRQLGDGRRLPAGKRLRSLFPLMRDRHRFRRKLGQHRHHLAVIHEERRTKRLNRERKRLYSTVCTIPAAVASSVYHSRPRTAPPTSTGATATPTVARPPTPPRNQARRHRLYARRRRPMAQPAAPPQRHKPVAERLSDPLWQSWTEDTPRRCIVRCFQEGRRLDRVAVRVFEPLSCFTSTVVVRQDLMHMVLTAVYGEAQQLRYLFNRVTLRHLCDMLVVRRNSHRAYVAVRLPPHNGRILRHGTMQLDGHVAQVRVVERHTRLHVEVFSRHRVQQPPPLQLSVDVLMLVLAEALGDEELALTHIAAAGAMDALPATTWQRLSSQGSGARSTAAAIRPADIPEGLTDARQRVWWLAKERDISKPLVQLIARSVQGLQKRYGEMEEVTLRQMGARQRAARAVQSHWARVRNYRIGRLALQVAALKSYRKIYDADQRQYYYYQSRTGQCSWEKPQSLGEVDVQPVDEWKKFTNRAGGTMFFNEYNGRTSRFDRPAAVRVIQRAVKRYQARLGAMDLPTLVKALTVKRRVEDQLARPNDDAKNFLIRTLNEALYFHCIKLDFDRARALYGSLPKKHPAVLWAWGVFVLADNQAPRRVEWERAQQAMQQARERDDFAAEFYNIQQCFFQFGLFANPNSSLAILNFALVLQCVTRRFKAAETMYRRALALDIENDALYVNYRNFLKQRRPGGLYPDPAPPKIVVWRAKPGYEWMPSVNIPPEIKARPDFPEWQLYRDYAAKDERRMEFWKHKRTGVCVWTLPGEEMRKSVQWLNDARRRRGLTIVEEEEEDGRPATPAITLEHGRVAALGDDESKTGAALMRDARPETPDRDDAVAMQATQTKRSASRKPSKRVPDVDLAASWRRRPSNKTYF